MRTIRQGKTANNRLRQRKKEQLTRDLDGYAPEAPIVVGCPFCKIGVSRSLLEMDASREVLHTLEFLAGLRHGKAWMEDFSRLLAQTEARNGVQTLT